MGAWRSLRRHQVGAARGRGRVRGRTRRACARARKGGGGLAGSIARQGSAISIELDELVPTPPPVPPARTSTAGPAPGIKGPPLRQDPKPPTGSPPFSNVAGPRVDARQPGAARRQSRGAERAEARRHQGPRVEALAKIAREPRRRSARRHRHRRTAPQPAIDAPALPADTTETPAIVRGTRWSPAAPSPFASTSAHVRPTQGATSTTSRQREPNGKNGTSRRREYSPATSSRDVQKPALQGLTRGVGTTPEGQPSRTARLRLPRRLPAPPAATVRQKSTTRRSHVAGGARRRVARRERRPRRAGRDVVSAITVDAVLVALEPNADLTAWLRRGVSHG